MNPTHEFTDFCRSLGLQPRSVVPDGKWRRCPTDEHPRKRNGAYKLAADGWVGWVQDWSRMDAPVMWRAGKDSGLPAFDVNAFRRQQADARRAAAEATAAARAFYDDCQPLRGGHPYLEAHGLDMRGCEGLKVDEDGWLVVPALKARALMSVQRISPEGDKRFWKGASVAGTSYVVDRRNAAVTVLCEGLATGLACYRALPHSRVVVAWNAGNMVTVAEQGAAGMVVVAADNDHGTEERIGKNPGIEAARKAAERIGCGIAHPSGICGTDWCDYLVERTAERMESRGQWETRASVRQAVEAEIRGALMREARFQGGAHG